MEFFKTARAACEVSFHGLCNHIGIPEDSLSDSHFDQIWSAIRTSWLDRNRLDLEEKCAQISRDCLGQMVSLDEIGYSRQEYRELIQRWKEVLPTILEDSHRKTREAFTKNRVTPQYLAQRTEQVYRFVREQLQVPFQLGIKDHPVFDKDDAVEVKRTIGTYVSRIYTAIRNEEMARLLLDVMEGVDTSMPPEKKNMGVKA
jgi:phenylalanine ammonia-lyase